MREVCSGLRLYFSKCLGNNLLYRFERGQYAEQQGTSAACLPWDHKKSLIRWVWTDKDVAQVYGAEHLLRLFGMLWTWSLPPVTRADTSFPRSELAGVAGSHDDGRRSLDSAQRCAA